MSTSKVDQKYRIVVDKQIRKRTNIKAGDIVIIEPLDDHSFKVNILDFTPETLENDPAWQALSKPAKAKKRIPPEKLEEIMEETTWQE
jgi:AbrB family looped-hinge helix DNA binding protein